MSTATAPLLAALRGQRPSRRPVWYMRQAGRSLPEYRAAREGTSMLGACLDPELAAEITCQPVRRYDVDAAIFFSDIVVPLKLAGVDVQIVPGVGPVVENPVRSRADVAALPPLDPEALRPVREGVINSVAQLGGVPLIGFAGAPFTVASYLVEGGPNRELPQTKALLAEDPETWHSLLSWVADVCAAFLTAQVEAGARAVQLFDSWAGRLGPAQYRSAAQRHSATVLAAIGDLEPSRRVPRIHFGTGTKDLLPDMLAAGADVIGVASDIGLDEANHLLGGKVPLQGNLDPALLSADWPTLEAAVRDVVHRGSHAPGHVFNLGHGVPPDTDPATLARVTDLVHSVEFEEN